MAAPTFVNAGTGVVVTNSLQTCTSGTGSAGDLLVLQICLDGSSTTFVSVLKNGSGFATLDGVDDSTRAAALLNAANTTDVVWGGDGTNVHQRLFFARATGTGAASIDLDAPTQTEDQYARWYRFSNVYAAKIWQDLAENGGSSSATTLGTSTTIADAGVTTNGPDRLCVNFVIVNDDNVVGAFTGMTGGTWAEAVAAFASATGTDACIQLQTATLSSAGTIDGGTYTMAASDGWGVLGFALISSDNRKAASFTANAVIKRTFKFQGQPDITDTDSFWLRGFTAGIRHAVYANGWWVGCGDDGNIWYRNDPNPEGPWTYVDVSAATEHFDWIEYGNGYWVAYGATQTGITLFYATSPDGTWTSNPPTGSSGSAFAIYGNGYWFINGGSGVWWYQAGVPTGTWTAGTTFDAAIRGVGYANGYWVVQTTGYTWYQALVPTGTWTQGDVQSPTAYGRQWYEDGRWVTRTQNGVKYNSNTPPSGSWTTNTLGSGLNLYALYYANGTWLLEGYAGWAKYTTDPTGSWTDKSTGAGDTTVGWWAAHGGTKYWAAGWDADVWVLSHGIYADAFIPYFFTADAWISSGELGGSFSADAVIFRNSGTKTFTAEAVVKKTISGASQTFTADAVVKKTQATGKTFAVEAIIFRNSGTKTFSADAVIVRLIFSDNFSRTVEHGLGGGWSFSDDDLIGQVLPEGSFVSVNGSYGLYTQPSPGSDSWESYRGMPSVSYGILQFDFYIDGTGYQDRFMVWPLGYVPWEYYFDINWDHLLHPDHIHLNIIPGVLAPPEPYSVGWWTAKILWRNDPVDGGLQGGKLWKSVDPEPQSWTTAEIAYVAKQPLLIFDFANIEDATTRIDNVYLWSSDTSWTQSLQFFANAVIRKTISGAQQTFTADAIIAKLVLLDTFDRTVASGWGTSDNGVVYSPAYDDEPDWAASSVSGGYGRVPVASYPFFWIPLPIRGLSYAKYVVNETSGFALVYSLDPWEFIEVSTQTGQKVSAYVSVTGPDLLVSAANGETWHSKIYWEIDTGIAGAKVWKDGDPEPSDWQATQISQEEWIANSGRRDGWVGINPYANSNATGEYLLDSLKILSLQPMLLAARWFTANAFVQPYFTADAYIIDPQLIWSDDFDRVEFNSIASRYGLVTSGPASSSAFSYGVDGSIYADFTDASHAWIYGSGAPIPDRDFEVQFDFLLSDVSDAGQLYAGLYDAAYVRAYGSSLQISVSTLQNIYEVALASLSLGSWYRVRVRSCYWDATQDRVFVKLWEVGDTEPDWVNELAERTANPLALVEVDATANGTTRLDNLRIWALGPGSRYVAFTADAYIDPAVPGTMERSYVTANARIEYGFTANAWLAGTFTADAWISSGVGGSFSADAVIFKAGITPGTQPTADAVIFRNSGTKTFSADAVVKKTQETGKTFSAEAISRKSGIAGTPFNAEAIRKVTQAIGTTFSAESVIFANSGTKTFSVEAALLKTQATGTSFSAEAIELKTQSGALSTDAFVLGWFTIDARVGGAYLFSAAAIVSKTTSVTDVPVEAIKLDTISVTERTADAIKKRTQSGSLAVDAFILGWFRADARIAGHLFIDATIRRTQSDGTTFTVDAVKRETISVSNKTIDAVVLRSWEVTTTKADAAIRKTITVPTTTANAILLSPMPPYDVQAMLESTSFTGSFGTSSAPYVAQSFVPGHSGLLVSIGLRVYAQNTPTDDVVVELRPDASGVPSDTVIATLATLDITSTSIPPALFPVSISPTLVSEGSKYWLVLRRSGSLDNTNYYRYAYKFNSGYTAGERAIYTTSWTAYSDSDWGFWAYTKYGYELSLSSVISRREEKTFAAEAIKFETIWVANKTADAVIRKTITSLFFAAEAITLRTQGGSFSAEAVVRSTEEWTFSVEALRSSVGRCVWTTPGNTVSISSTAALAFYMPDACDPDLAMHFEIQLDVADTFDTGSLWIIKSHLDQTGWQYWDGGAWQAIPQGGVPFAYCGNEARYTIQTPLTNGTWYRRVRAGVI